MQRSLLLRAKVLLKYALIYTMKEVVVPKMKSTCIIAPCGARLANLINS